MNMLIIGNGFDIAHDRPTRYEDFLRFLEAIQRTRDAFEEKQQFVQWLGEQGFAKPVKEYVLSAYESRKLNGMADANNENLLIQEMYNCLDKNVWYPYFRWIQVNDLARGKNWVDFESEIRVVIEFFDHQISDLYDCLPPALGVFPDCTRKIEFFWSQLDFTDYNLKNHKSPSYHNTYFDLIEKTYQDLEKLIRCLEIYLDDCVAKIPITRYSQDIKELKCDSVLSFNYTAIPTDLYSLPENTTHYIHGHALAERPAADNNMVLGINEYWDDSEKDFRTNFNMFKKFVQRIVKRTGIGYKKTLKIMLSDYEDSKQYAKRFGESAHQYFNNIYIFGHSLDTTDGDILREIIRTDGVVTTIFYRSKQQQANQIANLSKVLGQDDLLKRTFSTEPTIIFKQQADIEKI